MAVCCSSASSARVSPARALRRLAAEELRPRAAVSASPRRFLTGPPLRAGAPFHYFPLATLRRDLGKLGVREIGIRTWEVKIGTDRAKRKAGLDRQVELHV